MRPCASAGACAATSTPTLMRYRGWSTGGLEREYFTLRLRKLLGPDGVAGALNDLALAARLCGVTMQEVADSTSRFVARMARRYPMDDPETADTP